MVAVRSGVGTDFHEDTGDLAVFVSGHLNVHAHRVTGGVRDEFFLTCVVCQDRFACDKCCIRGQVFDQDILLRAVAAANTFLDDMDLILREAGDPADDTADMVRNLCRRDDCQAAGIHLGIADMRLKRCVLDLAGLIGVLDNSVRFGKGFFNITDTALVGRRNILVDVCMQRERIVHLALAFITLQSIILVKVIGCAHAEFYRAVVDQRSSLSHSLFDCEDGRLHIVVNLDQVARFDSRLECVCHNTRDTVAYMADLEVKESSVMR